MKPGRRFLRGDTVRHAVSHFVAGCILLLHARTILVLLLMLCIGIGCMLWYVSHLQSNLIASIALQDASLYSQALAEVRTLYTSEVVETVRKRGIEVTHDYETQEGAIPLPVTLSMLLGKRIGAHQAGAQTRLYSPYPFPSRREEGGLQDAFGQAAWDYLRQNPHTPFYRFEEFRGRRSLRYATADLMRPHCVGCHNTHPASPKTDWQTGDVRGVLEVVFPLDIAVVQTRMGLRGSFALMVVMAVLGMSGLALVIGRLRRSSADLEQRASILEREIAERRRVEAGLRESEGKYQHIVNAAADAIISIDEHGLVCEFNHAAEQIFGFTKAELLGKPLTPIMPPSLRDLHTAGLQRYLTTGQRHLPRWHHIELPGCTKDGREFPLEISFSLLEAEGKKFLTGVLRDITERKQAEAELHQARETAEAATQAKSAFLANMSHELRTPLNAIIGYSEMLQEEAEELGYTDVTSDLQKINAAGQHLLALISDILDLSKIEAGRMDLFLETFDLATMLHDVATTVQPLVEKNANTLVVRHAANLGAIRADLTKVRQSLFNLLSNACKFTQQGIISLHATRQAEGETEWVTLQVSDTGIGIPPEQLGRLFQAFAQAEASTARQYGGAGLGLAITKKFCQLMGGNVNVESELGKGSTFTIRLPTEVPTATGKAG
jgi:PAS domain S-box-containing protein